MKTDIHPRTQQPVSAPAQYIRHALDPGQIHTDNLLQLSSFYTGKQKLVDTAVVWSASARSYGKETLAFARFVSPTRLSRAAEIERELSDPSYRTRLTPARELGREHSRLAR